MRLQGFKQGFELGVIIVGEIGHEWLCFYRTLQYLLCYAVCVLQVLGYEDIVVIDALKPVGTCGDLVVRRLEYDDRCADY